jgi:ATP-binding cassette subfamily B protein
MLLAAGATRLIPWLLKLAIDALKSSGAGAGPREALPRILALGAGMVAAGVAAAAFLYLQRWLIIGASRHVEYDLRQDLFRHVQGLDLGFFGRKKTGDLMANFTNDLNALRDVAGPGLMYAASMTIALVSSIALMIAISPTLTLVAFAPYPLVSVVTFFFGRAMYRRSRRVQDLFGAISSRAQEDLTGARVIRAYRQEDACAGNFLRLNAAYLEANLDVARLRARFVAAMEVLAGSGLVVALLVGGRQVIRGTLSLGSLVAFSAYLAELIWPVIAVGFVIGMLQRGSSAAGRIEEVLRAAPEIVPGPRRERPAPRIAFERVSFRYPGATADALREVSFVLEPGRTLGIVGRTGSGKSTVLKLLPRFYDPTGGRITLDGVDLRERDLDALRASIGYAPQDAFLFSRTVAENIAYGAPQAGRAAIEEAAARVGLRGEIEGFPGGFDAMVGERGITLSGGQRQRVSLARALLPEPELLLLDDTLSSVDAVTETVILEQLQRYRAGRTAIVVSHRISAVRDAHRILVLDGGRVVEEGDHAALVARGGLYARLHERQRIAAELEGA